MTAPTTIRGSRLLIKIGDGADPEVFTHPCSINAERGIEFSAEMTTTNVPDCDDPEAAQWTGREKKGKSATITGQGVLNASDQDLYFEWFDSEDTKNVKVADTISGASGGRIYTGAFHLTRFRKTGTVGDKVQVEITLESDGAITKSNAA